MAQITTHALSYAFENIIKARLRSLKVQRPKQIAEEITPLLIDEVPFEAFEAASIDDRGYLIFHGDVDEDRCRAIQEALLQTHINLKTGLPITLLLSTEGGDVFSGLSVVSVMQRLRRDGRRVNVHIVGCAFSMGAIIAQGADHRSMDALSWLMLHQIEEGIPSGTKTSEARDIIGTNERIDAQICALFAGRTGRSKEYWARKMHRRDAYLSAEEALTEGLVDEVLYPPRYQRARRRRDAA